MRQLYLVLGTITVGAFLINILIILFGNTNNVGGLYYLDGLTICGLICMLVTIILFAYGKYNLYTPQEKVSKKVITVGFAVLLSFISSVFIYHFYQNTAQNDLLNKSLWTDRRASQYYTLVAKNILQHYYGNKSDLSPREYAELQVNLKRNIVQNGLPLAIVDENNTVIASNASNEELKDSTFRWYEYVKPIKVGNKTFKIRESMDLHNYKITSMEFSNNYIPVFLLKSKNRAAYQSWLSNYMKHMKNFFMLFTVLSALSLLSLVSYKAEKRVRDVNIEILANQAQKEAAYLELENFRHTYNKIKNDFVNIVNNSKNSMQQVQSTWDEMEKQSARLERHDIVNTLRALKDYRVNQNIVSSDFKIDSKQVNAYKNIVDEINATYNIDFLEDTYITFIEPCINTIHKELKGLENVLDLNIQEYPIKEILDVFGKETCIPKGISKDNSFSKNLADFSKYDGKCNVVLSKIESIVFNLLANSAKANQDYFEQHLLDDDFDYENYKGKISLDIFPLKEANKDYLCIQVSDSGGGFNESIIHDIYKRPIKTTKDSLRDYGEATVYIGFFVRLMNGQIIAENYNVDDRVVGARTKILIPFI